MQNTYISVLSLFLQQVWVFFSLFSYHLCTFYTFALVHNVFLFPFIREEKTLCKYLLR